MSSTQVESAQGVRMLSGFDPNLVPSGSAGLYLGRAVDSHRTPPAMSSATIVGGAVVVSGPHQPSTRLDVVTLAEQ